MPNLVHQFDLAGRRLVLLANIVNGWRKDRRAAGIWVGQRRELKTYCFSEIVRPEWQGGFISAQLSIFPRPGGLTAEWEAPPSLPEHRPRKADDRVRFVIYRNRDGTETKGLFDDCCTVGVSAGSLVASIDLLDDTLRRPRSLATRSNKNGDPFFARISYESVDGRVFDKCQIQVRLTFQVPQKSPPVYWSFWNEFLSGGLPETNRRKF